MFDNVTLPTREPVAMTAQTDEARELAVLSVYAEFGPLAGPSVRDAISRLEKIAPELGWSPHTVKRVLDRLVDKDDLFDADPWKDTRNGSRPAGSLRLTSQGTNRLRQAVSPESELGETALSLPPLPVVGELAAGTGVDIDSRAAADIEGLLDVLKPDPRDRVFIVRGESMEGARVYDGDYVVIRLIETIEEIRPQDPVVVIVREHGVEEVTLKYLHRGPDGLRLVPARAHIGAVDWQGNPYVNRTYDPALEDVQIIGVLRWRVGRPLPDLKAMLPGSPAT
jgi:SOS-response transcriptional repressor LexA